MTTEPTTLPGADGRTMTITRVFDAPRELVWRMFTEPEHFQHWFGTPPYKTPLDTISMDVQVGGLWAATMVSPDDASELPFAGRYREIVEPERLVFTFENIADRNDPNVEVATVTFTDLGGKTEVVLTQDGHLPLEQYARMYEGYTTFFDRLGAHLADL
jgi:uncharacterized protein YndB with AHSA1/START domain